MKSQSCYVSAEARAEDLAVYKEALVNWPLPLTRHYLPTSFGESFALAFATGKPGSEVETRPVPVLLDGVQSNSSRWFGEAEALAAERRVYAVNLPGELGYSPERRLPNDDNSLTFWLGKVLDGIEKLEAGTMAAK